MSILDPRHKIDFLVRVKFPQPGMSLSTAKRAELAAYQSELRNKPIVELDTLYATAMSTAIEQAQKRADFEESQLEFNRPTARADFDYWSKQAFWGLDEAISLAFGRDPKAVTWEKVSPYTLISPFAKQYERAREMAHRFVVIKELSLSVYPAVF